MVRPKIEAQEQQTAVPLPELRMEAVVTEERSDEGTALELKGLNVYYGSFRALKNINMQIAKHRITAIIGPSGCGKSTLIRCLNRMNDLIPVFRAEGEVLFENQNLYAR